MKVNQLQEGNTEVIRLGYFRTNVRLKSKSSLYETPGEKYPAVDEEGYFRTNVRRKSKSSLYETPGEKYPAVDEERQYRLLFFRLGL